MSEKTELLKKKYNVEFKNLRSCHHQTNDNTYVYHDITTCYIYIYDGFENDWYEDKDDIYNYTMFGFEEKNNEII